jgi:2-polyprenyl-6-methoxyphenol hydroxylase-like FAD-dependent oxidoreductase
MDDKTVLISGAGIAGPTLAYWLLEWGWRPTLVERSPRLRGGGYVIDFWAPASISPSGWGSFRA